MADTAGCEPEAVAAGAIEFETSDGAIKATAIGTYTWNTCIPDCAASNTWDKTTAALTLSDPVKTTDSWLFERLTVRITGPAPHEIQRITTYPEAPHPS